ncbi:hypothetical protein DFS34DRAFT_613103 [Phlyctochytrium arcticum]|nr:hypothetical protein DFS34DRAFT_613103 [Phlyctochytrium arcticum]
MSMFARSRSFCAVARACCGRAGVAAISRSSGVQPTRMLSPYKAFTVSAPRFASHSPLGSENQGSKAQEWFKDGTRKWNEDDIQGALDCFEKSAWSQPTADAYYNIANCHLQLGKHEAAIKAWEKSLELDPDNADVHVNLANVYALIVKDSDKAVKHYEKAVKLDPEDGEIRFNFAVVLDSMNRLEHAIEQYKLAVEKGATVAEKNLRNAMARLLGQQLKAEEEAKGKK